MLLLLVQQSTGEVTYASRVITHKMFRYFILCAINLILISCQNDVSSVLENRNTPIKLVEINPTREECIPLADKVTLKLFYESLCPDCMAFDPVFARVAVDLYDYINVATYPYGNAHMEKKSDGSVVVKCQHGERECYGNKLHACALDLINDAPLALQYNACMMPLRSNDTSAVQCGKTTGVTSHTVKRIMKCAKGSAGERLLEKYGKESELVNFQYVPYVLLNGAEWSGEPDDFMKDVCAAFTNMPAPCLKCK